MRTQNQGGGSPSHRPDGCTPASFLTAPGTDTLSEPGEATGTTDGGCKRWLWADASMNGGQTVPIGRLTQPQRAARAWLEGFTMKVRTRVTWCIEVNVAACLFGIAAIIKALM
jgi:hypothetical protein